mmetsp:Transcript_49493/g.115770  ORF Transcript_49493/g.115770 Transcript_49493/m.115770 type:complete len:242 (+) Transcript_49493:101-826(+)
MLCRPAAQFCCGCSVKFGVQFILLVHIISICITLLYYSGRLILKWPTCGYPSAHPGYDASLVAFELAGLPIALLALWATRRNLEGPLRLYFAYMLVQVSFNVVYVAYNYILSGPCTALMPAMISSGRAFVCGIMRGSTLTLFLMTTGLQLYCIFIVMSHCEDLKEGGAGYSFEDLSDGISAGDLQRQSKQRNSQYGGLASEFITETCPDSMKGLGGSHKIGNWGYHEMQYPPPRAPRCYKV